jgi:hypothetical protein
MSPKHKVIIQDKDIIEGYFYLKNNKLLCHVMVEVIPIRRRISYYALNGQMLFLFEE